MKIVYYLSFIGLWGCVLGALFLMAMGLGPSGPIEQRGDDLAYGAGVAILACVVFLPLIGWSKGRAYP